MKKAKIHPQIPYLRIIIRQITSMQLPQTSSFHTLPCCVRTIAFVIFISCWRTRHVPPHNPPPCIQIKCTYLADESLGGREGMSQQVICPEVSPLVEENGNTNVTRPRGLATQRSHGPHGLPAGHLRLFHSILDLNFATLCHGSEVVEALIYQCVFCVLCFLSLHSYTLTLEQHGFELRKSIYMPIFFNTVSLLYSWVLNPRLQLTVDKR